MKLKNNLRIHNFSVLSVICAIIFVIIAFIVRNYTGSPYRVINYCGSKELIPPVWVMVVSWYLWYVVLGATFGSVIGCTKTANEVKKYKGGMIFLLMMALGYVWYPLFFGSVALFGALMVCETVFVLSVLCALYFRCVDRGAGYIMMFFSLWMLWMVILNIRVLLNC